MEREQLFSLSRFAEFGKNAAGIFHDLVHPLTSLTLSLSDINELVTIETGDIDKLKQSLSTAVAAAKQMEQYISCIRKELKREVCIESFSFVQEIERVMLLLRYQCIQASVSCKFGYASDIHFCGNSRKFMQVISNLVINAVDAYTEVSRDEKVILLSLTETDHEITIHIEDHATGISESIQSKLFMPFATSKENGIGLGLYTVRDIIEHDFLGTIECKSIQDVGTTFILHIPKKV